MRHSHRTASKFITALLLLLAWVGLPLAAGLTAAKAEEVGVSSERLQRLHDTIQRHIEARDFSGAVTLVARKGRVVQFEAQGTTDLESKRPMSKDAVFRIASMSKPITAVAVLMLMEEGKVRLTDPIARFIPEFKALKVAVTTDQDHFYTVPSTREITIRDLLTHTSGLVSGGVSASEAAKSPRRPLETLADYIPRLANVPLAFQPGSRWTYSPLAAFDTLGRIVEIVSGQHFDAFLEQRIFAPLAMKDTCFELPQDRIPRLVTLLDKTPQGLEKYSNQNLLLDKHYFSGGGGLMSTAEDYLQFAQMLLEGGQLNGKRLLSPKTIELMSTPHVPDSVAGRMPGRAFGLSVQIVTDPIAASFRVSPGSYGWDGAFGTHFWVDPKEKIVGILMVQTRTPNREADRDVESAVMQALID